MSEIVVSNFTLVSETQPASGKPNFVKAIYGVSVDGFTLPRVLLIDDGTRVFISLPRGRCTVTGRFFRFSSINDGVRWRTIAKTILDHYALAQPRRVQPATASEGEHIGPKASCGLAWGMRIDAHCEPQKPAHARGGVSASLRLAAIRSPTSGQTAPTAAERPARDRLSGHPRPT